jgi:hypothetical protein
VRNIQPGPTSAQILTFHRSSHTAERRVPIDRDKELEQQIETQFQKMICATSTRASTDACRRMTALIQRRSAAQVARMERERGLVIC